MICRSRTIHFADSEQPNQYQFDNFDWFFHFVEHF
jgi:hypothetical protein